MGATRHEVRSPAIRGPIQFNRSRESQVMTRGVQVNAVRRSSLPGYSPKDIPKAGQKECRTTPRSMSPTMRIGWSLQDKVTKVHLEIQVLERMASREKL